LGFALKRAQWQFVRNQGGERICWTYDPLLSRNANLNIAKLGAICNTNIPDYYGEMRDGLNAGLPSDRFRVDWWVNTARVEKRLSRTSRRRLDLAQYPSAEAKLINPVHEWIAAFPAPPADVTSIPNRQSGLLLVEIPADFQALRTANPPLALNWRIHSRQVFQACFARGYIVTDFVFEPGNPPRSFYILSHGDSTF
jgi:predicted GNAT superfamily acetyltransferase